MLQSYFLVCLILTIRNALERINFIPWNIRLVYTKEDI